MTAGHSGPNKTREVRWLGHLERMEEYRVPKKLFISRPEGRKNGGRPRLRWLDEVEENLWELVLRRWRTVEECGCKGKGCSAKVEEEESVILCR